MIMSFPSISNSNIDASCRFFIPCLYLRHILLIQRHRLFYPSWKKLRKGMGKRLVARAEMTHSLTTGRESTVHNSSLLSRKHYTITISSPYQHLMVCCRFNDLEEWTMPKIRTSSRMGLFTKLPRVSGRLKDKSDVKRGSLSQWVFPFSLLRGSLSISFFITDCQRHRKDFPYVPLSLSSMHSEMEIGRWETVFKWVKVSRWRKKIIQTSSNICSWVIPLFFDLYYRAK